MQYLRQLDGACATRCECQRTIRTPITSADPQLHGFRLPKDPGTQNGTSYWLWYGLPSRVDRSSSSREPRMWSSLLSIRHPPTAIPCFQPSKVSSSCQAGVTLAQAHYVSQRGERSGESGLYFFFFILELAAGLISSLSLLCSVVVANTVPVPVLTVLARLSEVDPHSAVPYRYRYRNTY